VTFSTLFLNWKISGDRPFAYHLVNWLLHAGVTVLLFLVLKAILGSQPRGDWVAFAAALLFAVHPIHTEAVASIVGRSELLAAGFLLAAWLFHLRGRAILGVLCFALALLSKESAIAFLPLALAGDYARGKLEPWTRYAPIAIATLLYIFLLWKAHGDRLGLEHIALLDNPLAHLPPLWRILNALRVGWKYVALQTFPVTLSCDYSFDAIPLYANLRNTLPAAVATLVALAAWGWAIWKRQSGLMLAGAIYLAGFATTANIFVSTGTIMGERLAYLPSAGFCLLIALGCRRVEVNYRAAATAILLLLTAAFGVRTLARNRDWKDDLTLYQADVRAVPGSAKIHSNLGHEYLNRRQFDLARTELQAALKIYPDYPDTMETLGLVESWTGHESEALRLMNRALQMSDRGNINYDYMAVNLAAMLMQVGRSNDALQVLDREIAESPEYSRAWSNRAVIHYQRGESAMARSDAESALRLEPSNSQALGVLSRANAVLPSSPH
jgi:Tfp pilus assembly protein PilF